MEDMVGKFGRFWDKPVFISESITYVYGYLKRFDQSGRFKFLDDDGTRWENFDVATVQPEWNERRRVIKDRAKLVRTLLDMGFLPDDDGDFVPMDHNTDGKSRWYFSADTFGLCGKDVEWHEGFSSWYCYDTIINEALTEVY